MIAIDTNVVIRFLTRDDRSQAERARALLRGEAVFVSKTVLLESEWVLRGGYGFAPSAIAKAFRGLLGLPGVAVEDRPAVHQAMTWYERGIDYADALHLAGGAAAGRFATFDKALRRQARKLEDAPAVVEP